MVCKLVTSFRDKHFALFKIREIIRIFNFITQNNNFDHNSYFFLGILENHNIKTVIKKNLCRIITLYLDDSVSNKELGLVLKSADFTTTELAIAAGKPILISKS